MPSPAPRLIGSVIGGRYEVLRELGAGGMGSVLEVRHVDLGRPFAMKLLHLGQRTAELEQRFRREARALAMVQSARVAQVTDFGVDEALGPWYVMELVDGESLEDRLIRGGAIRLDEGLEIAEALLEAVADVHDASLVHRDLKPSNIGLPHAGPVKVKLLDFGLAASIDDAFLTRITRSQQVLGSLPYIAPEQFGGSRPSTAADLWAVGIVLHEALTGQLPFEAPTTAAMMHAILAAPAPRLVGAPPPVAALLDGLLEKDPERRLRSAREAAQRVAAIRRAGVDGGVVVAANGREAVTAATGVTPPPSGPGVEARSSGHAVPGARFESSTDSTLALVGVRRRRRAGLWVAWAAAGLAGGALAAFLVQRARTAPDAGAEAPAVAAAPSAGATASAPSELAREPIDPGASTRDEEARTARPSEADDDDTARAAEPEEASDAEAANAATTTRAQPRRPATATRPAAERPATVSEDTTAAAMTTTRRPPGWQGEIIEDPEW